MGLNPISCVLNKSPTQVRIFILFFNLSFNFGIFWLTLWVLCRTSSILCQTSSILCWSLEQSLCRFTESCWPNQISCIQELYNSVKTLWEFTKSLLCSKHGSASQRLVGATNCMNHLIPVESSALMPLVKELY